MLHKTIHFRCDFITCKNEAEFVCIEYARKAGWAVCRDRRHCYCPHCAPYHRHVGRSDLGRRTYVNGYSIGDERD